MLYIRHVQFLYLNSHFKAKNNKNFNTHSQTLARSRTNPNTTYI